MSSEEEDDKENARLHRRRKRKNMEGADTGERIGRRGQYLKEIAKRFQRPGGTGRGRITLHQPLDVFDFSQEYVSNFSLSIFLSDGRFGM